MDATTRPNPDHQIQQQELEEEPRNLWILTGYAVSFLALLGVLAFYFSDFATR